MIGSVQQIHNAHTREGTDHAQVLESIGRLESWLNGNYEGWDPYDGINNDKIAKLRWGRPYLQIGLVQLNRLSPLNLREFLGVKKGVSTKGLSVFVQAYLILYSATGKEEYLTEASRLGRMIIDSSLIGKYGKHAWASHHFTFASVDGGATTPDSFDLIGTCNVLKAISMLHQITRDDRLEVIIGSCQSFLQELVERRDGIAYFQYAPQYKQKIVPNASAEALAAIALSLRSRWNEELHMVCDEVLRAILKMQREDGSWVYSIYNDGREYNQLDFHQGYLVSGLLAYRGYAPEETRPEVERAIKRATTFYEGLFRDDGQSLYRAPRRYPVDIHNQAQGIITFAQLGEVYNHRQFTSIASKIADWTISHMQDSSGYFYYQKWPLITNKIPYMRWGQAWMLLALASLYAQQTKEVDVDHDR